MCLPQLEQSTFLESGETVRARSMAKLKFDHLGEEIKALVIDHVCRVTMTMSDLEVYLS